MPHNSGWAGGRMPNNTGWAGDGCTRLLDERGTEAPDTRYGADSGRMGGMRARKLQDGKVDRPGSFRMGEQVGPENADWVPGVVPTSSHTTLDWGSGGHRILWLVVRAGVAAATPNNCIYVWPFVFLSAGV